MVQISVTLLACVFLSSSIASYVHNHHLRNAVDVYLLETSSSGRQMLNLHHITEEGNEQQATAHSVTPTNPFGLPGMSKMAAWYCSS